MNALRPLLFAAIGGLALAACARVDAPPDRQPGLWEQQVAIGDVIRTINVCLDDDTDRKVDWWGTQMNRRNCEVHKVGGREDGGWNFRSICDMGANGKVTTTGVAYGDFVHRFLVRGGQSTSGAALADANRAVKVSIDAKYLEPCPTPYQPGDMWISGLKPKPDDSTVKQVGPVPYNDNATPMHQVFTIEEADKVAAVQ